MWLTLTCHVLPRASCSSPQARVTRHSPSPERLPFWAHCHPPQGLASLLEPSPPVTSEELRTGQHTIHLPGPNEPGIGDETMWRWEQSRERQTHTRESMHCLGEVASIRLQPAVATWESGSRSSSFPSDARNLGHYVKYLLC